jgi:predicted ATPase/DNA-binding XRE family transcriptional regulator
MSGDFGTLLRGFRTAATLSQQELAERARMSVEAIGALERGVRRSPYAATVKMLADALELGESERARLEAAVGRRRPRTVAVGEERAPEAPEDEPLPALIGRDRERAEVVALLGREDVNLVTLVGAGGIGKTRLAQAALATIAKESGVETGFVALAPVEQADLILPTIATALGVTDADEPTLEALARRLRERRTVVVIDNVEHLASESAEAIGHLCGLRGLTILVTSREPLRLRNERVVRLGPISATAARELFVDRALAAGSRIAFEAQDDDKVAQVVALLDGLPLAIELAAARMRLEPLAALARRLERRLDVLVGGPRDASARHRTMRSAIAWSYELCNAEERRLFRALALFPGGCTPEAAAAVLGDRDEFATVDTLTSLFDKSLVIEGGDDEALRFTMLPTIREFAAEQLTLDPESARLRRAFVEHVTGYAELLEGRFIGTEQGRAVAALEREHDNIRAALAWARDEGETTLGLRLAGALWRFWSRRGFLAEGGAWYAALLALPQRERDPDALAARARALLGAGMLAQRHGDLTRAQPYLEESLELNRRVGNDRGVFFVLNSLGLLAHAQGDLERSRSFHEESLAARRATGRARDVSVALVNLGVLALDRDDVAEAGDLLERSLLEMRAEPDPWVAALTLYHLAQVARRRGERERALALLEETLARRRDLLDARGVVLSLVSIAELADDAGDEAEALRRYRVAVEHNRRVESPEVYARCFEALATLLAGTDARRAATLLASAVGIASRSTSRARDASKTEALRARLRDALGAGEFEAASVAGAALDMDRAALLALAPP